MIYTAFIILLLILIYVLIKLFFINKSIREINNNMSEILNSDTNNLITISTSNKEIIKLVSDLNNELKNLRMQKLQYESGNQELKRNITNISHDLRTPLTAINGYIDFIKDNNKKERQKEYIEIIERKTNDLIELTESLFDFSKTIDNGIEIKKEKNCINEILEESLAGYYVIFTENNIQLKVEICEEKIYKNIDKNSIIRVFENILSNVTKYSNGDFKVMLDKNGKITFSNKATTLDATTVEKIFDRYYTVENAQRSTGLGLSIAKKLIELNNGKIVGKYIKGKIIIEIEFK